jgi:penicillin-binding protein 1A
LVKWIRLVASVLVLGVLLAVTLLVGVPVFENLSTLEQPGSLSTPLRLDPIAYPSTILAANGELLYVVGNGGYDTYVPLADLPKKAVQAILDVEDHTYFHHGAIDLKGIARAMVADITGGKILEGGSTITQQLVKNALLNQQRTVSRKVRELILSLRLQGQMTKKQILERYLNTVYFGEGAYGIGAAARVYFNEPASSLNVPQAALLASLIEDPNGLNPFIHPSAALFRRNIALLQMYQYGDITKRQMIDYQRYPLPKRPNLPPITAPSGFVSTVLEDLLHSPKYGFLGSNPSQRYQALATRGYRIYTTLNPTYEADARTAVSNRLPDTNGKFTAALVSIDPKDGNVVALISGNPVKGIGGYDVATGYGGTGRQPGSGFKLFTLAAALLSGYSPNDVIDGTSPCTFTVPGTTPFPYVAHNAEPGFGLVSLTKATADSINCAYIRLGVTVGLSKIVTMARIMGITTPLAPIPSMVIGSEDVYPIQIAAAYASVDDLGVYHQPRFITRVADMSGRLVYRNKPVARRVLPVWAAEEILAIMKKTIQYGTGTAASPLGRPAAGKTGTTDNFTDAWFNGMVPQLTTSVWVGDPRGSVPMYDVGGVTVYGGTYPTEIWETYNALALAGKPVFNWPSPDPSYISPGKLIVPIDAPGSITSEPTPGPNQMGNATSGGVTG